MFRAWLQELTRLAGPAERSLTRRLAALMGVLLVCAAVESYLLAHTETLARDGASYVRMARDWGADPHGVIDRWDYHPGYPVALAGVHDAGEAIGLWRGPAGWDRAGQVVSLLGALGTLAAVWAFAGLCLDDWRLAWLAALLLGLGRKWTMLGADVLSDTLAACLQMWALVLGVLAGRALLQGRWRAALWGAGSGVCAGVGYLVRPEALLVPAVGTGVFLLCRLRPRVRWRQVLGTIAVQAGCALAAAAPYMAAIGGLSKKKRLADLLFGSGGREAGMLLASARAGFLRKVTTQFAGAMHPVPTVLMLIAVVTWMVLHAARRPMPTRPRCSSAPVAMRFQLLVLGALGVVAAGLYRSVGYLSHRHVLLASLVLAPWAALGVVQICAMLNAWLARSATLAPLRRATFPLAVGALAAAMLAGSLRPLHMGKGHMREAGLYVAGLATEADHLLTDDSRVAHYARYADRPARVSILAPPDGAFERLLRRWLARRDLTLVALTADAWARVPADLRRRLQPPAAENAAHFSTTPGEGVFVVRLVRKAPPPVAPRPAPAATRPPDR